MVGVFLMVGLLFFLMVFILNFMDWASEQWSKCCGSKKAQEDQESAAQAAALVCPLIMFVIGVHCLMILLEIL